MDKDFIERMLVLENSNDVPVRYIRLMASEIKTLRAKVASAEVEKEELVKQNNLLEINLRKTKIELSEWDRSYKP